MLQEFKKFILRGNVLDLAVAVVIGAAFKTVVDGFVNFIVMPIIGIIGGKPTFDAYTITIRHSVIKWGSFVTAVVSFLIIAAALFVMIKSFETLQARRRAGEEEVAAEPLTVEGELLTEIRDLLRGVTPPGAASSPGTPTGPVG
ncbi:MAG: large conductance mechanosensitive channel protein [Acidimicrobiales bacterium]|nr:large conductance mechanosensitive channel protein [Acidimicrobiales bacterium]